MNNLIWRKIQIQMQVLVLPAEATAPVCPTKIPETSAEARRLHQEGIMLAVDRKNKDKSPDNKKLSGLLSFTRETGITPGLCQVRLQ
jgi:hypothetical protein